MRYYSITLKRKIISKFRVNMKVTYFYDYYIFCVDNSQQSVIFNLSALCITDTIDVSKGLSKIR